jgi:hypothetical protein
MRPNSGYLSLVPVACSIGLSAHRSKAFPDDTYFGLVIFALASLGWACCRLISRKKNPAGQGRGFSIRPPMVVERRGALTPTSDRQEMESEHAGNARGHRKVSCSPPRKCVPQRTKFKLSPGESGAHLLFTIVRIRTVIQLSPLDPRGYDFGGRSPFKRIGFHASAVQSNSAARGCRSCADLRDMRHAHEADARRAAPAIHQPRRMDLRLPLWRERQPDHPAQVLGSGGYTHDIPEGLSHSPQRGCRAQAFRPRRRGHFGADTAVHRPVRVGSSMTDWYYIAIGACSLAATTLAFAILFTL